MLSLPGENHTGDFTAIDGSNGRDYRLSFRGTKKVVPILRVHLCRYVSVTPDECSILPHDVYEGSMVNGAEEALEEYIMNEKERILRAEFWEK